MKHQVHRAIWAGGRAVLNYLINGTGPGAFRVAHSDVIAETSIAFNDL
jgi:hypothetical protein